MTEIFNREMIKEKNLEALKKMVENDRKKVPKDQTSIKKKAEEKKMELLKHADENFNKLLEMIRK